MLPFKVRFFILLTTPQSWKFTVHFNFKELDNLEFVILRFFPLCLYEFLLLIL